MQRALMQWRNPLNHGLIREALRLCGRDELIGFGRECLVPPDSARGRFAQQPRGYAPSGRKPEGTGGSRNGSRGQAGEERRNSGAEKSAAFARRDNSPRQAQPTAQAQGRGQSRASSGGQRSGTRRER